MQEWDVRLSTGLGLFALLLGPAPLTAAPVLEKVVMISRHGVRAPLRAASVFNNLTQSDWPAWPVGPGEMTPHGAQSLSRMADFVRAHYAAAGLLPKDGCPAPGTVAVWSDVADTRTVQSGVIWADRLAPGCGVAAAHAETGMKDPIFDSKETNACPVGLIARGQALVGAALADAGPLRPDDRTALDTLQAIVAPGACTGGKGVCLVPSADASHATQAAALAAGSTLAEGLYLQYEQGFPPTDLGWGRADAGGITAILPLHEHGLGVLRKTPQLAARRGAVLARGILSLLGDGAWPPEAQRLPSGDARVIMFAGHDSNLLYLAGIMGLDWTLADQPSMTPPDGTLAFEVWQDSETGHRSVTIRFFAQTLAQIREATVLDATHPPDVVDVRPDACRDTAECALGDFSKAIDARLAEFCGR